MKIEKFQDIEIWQIGRQLSKLVFSLTNTGEFNKDLRFKYQIRAAAGSVMDNVAEGYGRGGNKEFVNFLLIARGSAEEVKSQLYRALDFQYISKEDFDNAMEMAGHLVKKTTNLISYLQTSDFKGPRYNSKEPDSPTWEPGTKEPGTKEPATKEPGTKEPGTKEPGTKEPGTKNEC